MSIYKIKQSDVPYVEEITNRLNVLNELYGNNMVCLILDSILSSKPIAFKSEEYQILTRHLNNLCNSYMFEDIYDVCEIIYGEMFIDPTTYYNRED